MVNRLTACIRTDASISIGTGHIMRCLTLALTLRENGVKVFFICRELLGNACNLIEQQGFSVFRLPSISEVSNASCEESISYLAKTWQHDATESGRILAACKNKIDWLIMDHYAFNELWEMKMRPYVEKIMVIDDLANRKHDCDFLLDQNFHINGFSRYQGLVPVSTQTFVGPQYALLRTEFTQTRETLCQRNGRVKRILIFFGGSDPTNETTKALEAIKLLKNPHIAVDVIVGASNPFKEKVKSICDQMLNCKYHCQINYMARLMAQADLAIGAGGSTTWERCCLGLPALVAVLADNQYEATTAVAEYGAIINMGRADTITSEAYAQVIESLDSKRLLDMQAKAMRLVDGKGRYRVVDQMLSGIR